MFIVHDTKAEEAAKDAAHSLMGIPGKGGTSKDYLDADSSLTWMRRENPEAKVITTLIREEPILAYVVERTTKSGSVYREIVDSPDPTAQQIETRHAIFSAELVIDGEVVARGHGSAYRAAFAGYFEKAETIAIRRMCIAAGYSLEMLRQLGFDLKRTAGDVPSDVERKNKSTAPANRNPAQTTTNPAPAHNPPPPATTSPTPAATDPEPVAASPSSQPTAAHPWAHLILSGEMATAHSAPDTPLGTVQVVPIADRKAWRKMIADMFDGNTSNGAVTFEQAIDFLAEIAGVEVWKWIILLQAAETPAHVNRIMVKSRLVSTQSTGAKIAGKAWSVATQERAQATAMPPS